MGYIDLTNQKFGKLTVIGQAPQEQPRLRFWHCECECGNTTVVGTTNLRSGHTKSCGCLVKNPQDLNVHRNTSNTKLYIVWTQMKKRCYDTKNGSYHRYGQRGIKVCDLWYNNFDAFNSWAIENGYKQGLTLDRINNDDNYFPENCRWANATVQANNRRSNKFIEFKGKRRTRAEWEDFLGLPKGTIYQRLKAGWSVEQCLSTKILPQGKRYSNSYISFNGKSMTVTDWAKEIGINKSTLYTRLHKGWSVERALTQKLEVKHHSL